MNALILILESDSRVIITAANKKSDVYRVQAVKLNLKLKVVVPYTSTATEINALTIIGSANSGFL
jgi:hypothetical protein